MRQQHARVSRRTAPVHPRRVSGPVRPRLAAAGTATLPRTGVFERIRALPDRRVVDRLLRGRLCIWVIGVLLGGIVAMQVSLLKLNSGISRAVEASSTLERENADMQAQIARLSSGQRVGQAAAAQGMIFPAAGDVGFLQARGALDDQLASRRMTPPSATAQAVMANGGHDPGTTVAPDPTAVTPAVTPTAVPQG
jgi:cell division protein FtsL